MLRSAVRWQRPLAAAAGLAAVSSAAAAPAARAYGSQSVELAHTAVPALPEAKTPVVVLIHGLDSSKQTWGGTIEKLKARGVGAIAFDLRGHGESELGEPRAWRFGAAQTLATDVYEAVEGAGLLEEGRRIVLVGHSMGGRVAMALAAAHPECLGALVIEDMDLEKRDFSGEVGVMTKEPSPVFERQCGSWSAARSALVSAGYDGKRVDGWKGARVYEKEGCATRRDIPAAAVNP